MRAGELRHRVTIYARTETSDGHEGFTETWPLVIANRIAANVRMLSGRDLERARAIDPRIAYEVDLRYWDGYVTDLAGGRRRVVWHDMTDRTLEMVGPPVEIEPKVKLLLSCREAA